MVRKGVVIGSVVAGLVVAAGLATLIWWLVTREEETAAPARFETIHLAGDGFGNVPHEAAFTRIPGSGDMLWWFYPTTASGGSARPLVLWLDGVTGLPPSLEANFGMFGPFDFDLNRRDDSWLNEYNLLFVDAPLGSGFSTLLSNDQIPINPTRNAEHLLLTLESFYSSNEEYTDAPLYIFGQGYGAQLALSLALRLKDAEHISPNVKGVVLGNPIVSPAVALKRLGFYLEELGYIDDTGRAAVESFSDATYNFVQYGQYANAFNNFLSLGEFVNNNAGAVAINMGHLTEKLTNTSTTSRDIFGQTKYLRDTSGFSQDFDLFMNGAVASALGISNAAFNVHREGILQAFSRSFMEPAVNQVERVLSETDLTVTIYNGNLDATSTTPGQLDWVYDLNWSGQSAFLNSARQTLVVNGLVEGYFQETDRLTFYWMNAAGLMVPRDSPVAMRRILQRIITS